MRMWWSPTGWRPQNCSPNCRHVEVIDAAKIPYGRAMAQGGHQRRPHRTAKAGQFVVRLKAATFVFARDMRKSLLWPTLGSPVTVVPGITSAIAVPALAGVPVTHRAVNHEFAVVSGHLAPDDPRLAGELEALAQLSGTIVLLMAVERIELFADALTRAAGPRRLRSRSSSTAPPRPSGSCAPPSLTPERIRDEGIRPRRSL